MARILITGLVLALFSLSSRPANADQLLLNGGFETGSIVPWQHNGTTLYTVTNPTNGGSHAAKFETTANPSVQEVYQAISPIAGGAYYTFSAHLAVEAPAAVGDLRLRISCYASSDASGLDLCAAETYVVPSLTTSYSFVTTGARYIDINARSVRVRIMVTPAGGVPVVVYLDDLSFEGPPKPLVTPTPTPTPFPTPSQVTPPPLTPTPTPQSPDVAFVPELLIFPALTNGGFESGRTDDTPYGWHDFGGVAARTTSYKTEGSYAAAFTSNTGSTKWVYQLVQVIGGRFYEFTASARRDDPGAEAVFLSVLWYASADGSGSNIGNEESTASLTVDSPGFHPLTTGPVPAPANAHSARLRLMLRPRSESATTVYFDNVTFAEVAAVEDNTSTASEASSGSRRRSGSRGFFGGSAPTTTVLAAEDNPGPLANVDSPAERTPRNKASGGLGQQAVTAIVLGLGLGFPLAGTSLWLAYSWWSRRKPEP